MRLDEEVDEQPVHRVGVVGEAVVPVRLHSTVGAVLESVQRARRRERYTLVASARTSVALDVLDPDQQRQQWIVPKSVVVVDVLVAEREGEHPLADELLDAELRTRWVAAVG